jgi:hypothetical protein
VDATFNRAGMELAGIAGIAEDAGEEYGSDVTWLLTVTDCFSSV